MPNVETSTPTNTPIPIGPYNHIARVGTLVTIGGTQASTPPRASSPARTSAARTVIGVSELPKPAVLVTMGLMAVTID